jgi:hypothetical protein
MGNAADTVDCEATLTVCPIRVDRPDRDRRVRQICAR